MRAQLLFLLYFLAATETFAGGISGSGPPAMLANCMANAIVVESLDDQHGYAFRNDLIEVDDTGLIGQMSLKAFTTFKNVVINSVDYSSIQSILGQNSKAVPVREVYFSENPNSIEMVLENDQVIHISPSSLMLSVGASSSCKSFMEIDEIVDWSIFSDNSIDANGSPAK